jgi:hypothetical protein
MNDTTAATIERMGVRRARDIDRNNLSQVG